MDTVFSKVGKFTLERLKTNLHAVKVDKKESLFTYNYQVLPHLSAKAQKQKWERGGNKKHIMRNCKTNLAITKYYFQLNQ